MVIAIAIAIYFIIIILITFVPNVMECIILTIITDTIIFIQPPHDEVVSGYFGFTPSVQSSRIPCPLCSAESSGWIIYTFTLLIKQLQKVRRI